MNMRCICVDTCLRCWTRLLQWAKGLGLLPTMLISDSLAGWFCNLEVIGWMVGVLGLGW